jgi:hypothetical protein
MAAEVQRWGLAWDRPTVGRKELGQRRFTAEELLVLPVVLNCRLIDLIEADQVRLPDTGVTYSAAAGGQHDGAEVEAGLLYKVAAGKRPFPKYLGMPPKAQKALPPVEEYLAALAEQRRPEVARIWPAAKPNMVAMAELSSKNDGERSAAKELGLSPFELALRSLKMWDEPFHVQRNRRAAQELGAREGEVNQAARNAHRAQVARKLVRELRQAITKEGGS